MFACSKSSNDTTFSAAFKKMLIDHLTKNKSTEKDFAETLINANSTAVFEVIDPEFDPHIIQYNEPVVVLLDVIKNSLVSFERFGNKEREEFASKFSFQSKKQYKTIENWAQFVSFYKEVTKDEFQVDGNFVEGFVVEDANSFMVKFKLKYVLFGLSTN